MSLKIIFLVSLCTSPVSGNAIGDESVAEDSSVGALSAMEMVFARSEASHTQSMVEIMKSMSTTKAWSILENRNLTNADLLQLKKQLDTKQSNLRQTPPATADASAGAPKGMSGVKSGYSGIEGARAMLNKMIYKSMTKYDEEVQDCTSSYAKHCADMEALRSQISSSNYMAAESRGLILDCQARIDRCEDDIPHAEQQLEDHLHMCKHELDLMSARLKVIDDDLKVLDGILNMTDCDKTFVQTGTVDLLRCQDPCSKKMFLSFSHDGLRMKLEQLKSNVSKAIVQDTLQDLLQDASPKSPKLVSLLQSRFVPGETDIEEPDVEVPVDPCTDKSDGAPSPRHKRKAKCTLNPGPQCDKIRERFLGIQGEILDEKNRIRLAEADFISYRDAVERTLEDQIATDEAILRDAEAALADATKKEAWSTSIAGETAVKHEDIEKEMKTKMKSCSRNYINFETELCALKKIRGELYKMKGSGHSAFFQDCQVGEWKAWWKCSKDCAGGKQWIYRRTMSPSVRGAECLPKWKYVSCNVHKCPVDCILEPWGEWSKCSAECDGGVQERMRAIKRAARNGGVPCKPTSQTRACNAQACQKDCVLSEWTKWSPCSKDCEGGTQKRSRYVEHWPIGQGKCADAWSEERLEYKECNAHACPLKMTCDKKLDVVLVLDGSGSMTQAGWDAEIKAAESLVDSFDVTDTKAKFSVIVYSGPWWYRQVKKCFGQSSKSDVSDFCKVKTHVELDSPEASDPAKVKQIIKSLVWPSGTTLTSLALFQALGQIEMGRADAKGTVVVFTDGRPWSNDRTKEASEQVRKKARLVWVPVASKVNVGIFHEMATRRWQENIVPVKDFDALGQPAVVTHLLADICPRSLD